MNSPNNPKLPNFIHPRSRPPDPKSQDVFMPDYQTDIKGEYIEDCDPIKEETQDSIEMKQLPSVQMPNYNRSPLPHRFSAPNRMPPFYPVPIAAPNHLSPLQLIQQLSTYQTAANKRKEDYNPRSNKRMKFDPRPILPPLIPNKEPLNLHNVIKDTVPFPNLVQNNRIQGNEKPKPKT